MTDNGMIEAFRGDSSFVMPECFYQASKFLLFLWYLNTVDPGLKIAGVTTRRLFPPCCIYLFMFCLYVFVFSGGYEGAKPPHCLFRHA